MSQAGIISPNKTVPVTVPTSFVTDSGTAVPVANVLTVKANPTSGSSVQFTGSSSTVTLKVTDSSLNTLVGVNSGNGSLSGSENTGVGSTCLHGLTTGIFNTAFGSRCMSSMQTGSSNTAVGLAALNANTAGNQNCAFGEQALEKNTGSNNTAVGYAAMDGTGSGSSNVAIGNACGNAITSGSSNSLLGNGAGTALTTGTNNVVVGNQSLFSVTTGSYNVAIGNTAGNAPVTGSESSNIYIQNTGVNAESNAIRIGTAGTNPGQQNVCYIAGINGVTVTGSAVLCSTAGQLGTVASSVRYKQNIENMEEGLPFMNLRPVKFNYKKDEEKKLAYGLIAEEVHEIFPYLCVYDDQNRPESVKYHELCVFLLKELQDMKKRMDLLERKASKP